jgi:NADH:ubiquinone reductase (H+-translocating)
MEGTTRILILGSGFAGIYTYLEFYKRAKGRTDLEVIMVSRDDHFLFMPLLHEVATGNLQPSSIRQPILSLPQERLDDFIQGDVTGVDLDSQTVSIRAERRGETIEDTLSYDYLVMALGSETAYYGVQGAKENSYPLKSLSDAKRIKNRVLEVFEDVQCRGEDADIASDLRFVIVGGGPTGVELAGELSDFIRNDISRAYSDLARSASIVLIDGGQRLVRQLDLWVSEEVREILERKHNVLVCLNTEVSEVRPDGIQLDDSFLETRTVIWSAGVVAHEVPLSHTHPVVLDDRSRRVSITPSLTLAPYPNVFVVGDQACLVDHETKQPYPMRAQFAVRQGVHAARNILLDLEGKPRASFDWNDQGIILSLGKGGALASIFGMRLSGPIAWIMYRGAYLFKMYGWRTKVRTAVEWILNFWTPRDISKL